MTSSRTAVVKEDTVTTADAFDIGAGRIDVGAAAAATVTLDETATDFFALGATDLTGIHLNIPSVNAPTLPGSVTTTRTVTNVTNVTQKFDVTTSTSADSSITVSPSKFNLEPGLSTMLTITIASDAPLGQQRFGTIRLTPKGGGAGLHLPVAFMHQQTPVGLTQSCTPTSVAIGASSVCTVTATNGSPVDVDVTLDTEFTKELKFGGAVGAVQTGARSVRATASLAPEAPGIPSIAPGSLAGYIPLDAFGVSPIPVGDEAIINFTVPPFVFAGKSYSGIGVDSNGYSIVGGGTSEDNNCCNLPGGPSPALPNNILAPFWTDLDGTGAPGIFAATLTDGVNTWIVLEHRLNVFGTSSLRVFQTWIGIDGTEDITYAYDPGNLPANPNGQDFQVGAENALGQGQFLPLGTLPTQDLRVSSSPGSPAESLTYTVTVIGKSTGTGVVTTGMTAPTLPGTTIVRSEVTVQ